MGTKWGFIGLTESGAPITSLTEFVGSNVTDVFSFSGLVKSLKQVGWYYIEPKALPAWFLETIGAVSTFTSHFGNYVGILGSNLDIVPLFFIYTPFPEELMPLPAGATMD
jgi:hypothetical protein